MNTLCIYVEDTLLKKEYIKYIQKRDKEKSGFDLFIPQKTVLNETTNINFNIRCVMLDKNNNPLPYYLYASNLLSKKNIRLTNGIIIIDKVYNKL